MNAARDESINGPTYSEWLKRLCEVSVKYYGYAEGAIEDGECWREEWEDGLTPDDVMQEELYAGS